MGTSSREQHLQDGGGQEAEEGPGKVKLMPEGNQHSAAKLQPDANWTRLLVTVDGEHLTPHPPAPRHPHSVTTAITSPHMPLASSMQLHGGGNCSPHLHGGDYRSGVLGMDPLQGQG